MEQEPTRPLDPGDGPTTVVSFAERFEEAWRQGRTPAIADFLPAPGSPWREEVLVELIGIDLEYRLEAERESRLEAYRLAFPELQRAGLAGRIGVRRRSPCADGNGAAQASDDRTREYPSVTWLDGQPPAGPGPAELPRVEADRVRYSLVRMHAEGGIGQVWAAHDHDLDREVALKRLRPAPTTTTSARARFLREAQVTGRLQHPGIVPVYELGRPGPGSESFYTMRFIRGRTLSEAIQGYHRDRKRGRAGPPELRELLAALLSVCQTVAYAHSRGVIHRDLKCQNIVLGDFGEVMVVDWGLAKVIGEAETTPETPRPPADLGGDAPPSDESAVRTVDGEILGTPAYMAPEQAQGRNDRIDARADVYGLGAILYKVLTGEPPFRGELVDVLRRVVEEPPTPPRRRVADVPRDLEGVCLKCLAKRPEDRYASASELADEIRRYLADQPVRAVAEPWTSMVRRWVDRHRAPAAAAAAGLVVLTVTLAVAAVSLKSSEEREARARGKAEENLELAKRAVERYFTRVSEDSRLKAVGLERLRQDLLRDAQGFFEQLSRDQGTGPQALAERARNDLLLARIDEELGESAEAAAAAEQARSFFDDLARRYPEVPSYREGLAESFESLGGGKQGALDLAGADVSFRRAVSEWEGLARGHADEPRYRHRTAVALNRLGRLLCMHMNKKADGIGVLNRSLSLCDAVLRDRPGDPGALLERSEALLVIGRARDPLEPGSVDETFGEALRVREALAEEFPESPSYRDSLVDACVFVASSYSNTRALDRLRAIYEKTRRISERLAREHPDLPLYAEKHALIEILGSLSMAMNGEHARAAADADRAAALAPRSGLVADYAACCLTIAAQAAGRDAQLAPADRQRQVDRYLDRAMDYLRQAQARGLFRQPHYVEGLKNDPDLELLRRRPDFRRFLSELEGSAASPARPAQAPGG